MKLIFALLLLTFLMSCSEPVNTKGNIFITEICIHPDSGKAEWIEIYNDSEDSIHLKGHRLLNNDSRNIKIPTVKIPPKNCILLVLDTVPDPDLPSVQTVTIKNAIQDFLPNYKGVVTLQDHEGDTIDYVMWSDSAHYYSFNDTTHVRFTSDVFYGILLGGYHKPYTQGSSIAKAFYGYTPNVTIHKVVHLLAPDRVPDTALIKRSEYYTWEVFYPNESTPGIYDPMGKTLIPQLCIPFGGYRIEPEDTLDFRRTFTILPFNNQKQGSFPVPPVEWQFIADSDSFTYQFGIYFDSTCIDTFIETEFSPKTQFDIDSTIGLDKPKDVYWRARAKHPDGTIGNWSEWEKLHIDIEGTREIYRYIVNYNWPK